MLNYELEVQNLMSKIDGDMDESYSFLSPLFAPTTHAPDRDIVLYAAGKTCERIYKYLIRKGVKVSAVCDKNKRGEFLDTGLRIITPEELLKKYRDAWIVVTTFNYSVDAITDLCLSYGIPEKNILRATLTSNFAYFSKEEFFNDMQLYNGYKYAYELGSDDVSKSVVLDVLRKDFTGYHHLTKTSTLSEEFAYFDFEFGEKEVFVQAGCYIGDTVEAFIKFRNNNQNDIIYTFDGDDGCYATSKQNLEKYTNVHLYKMGLWDKDDNFPFLNLNSYNSRILDWSSGYENTIKCTSLDSFFADKPELPTFIQLDIEGAEPQALLGAKNILQKAKPKLAICVYHSQDHIYSIPKIIQTINPDYKRFRFVQTANCLTDTILFAD